MLRIFFSLCFMLIALGNAFAWGTPGHQLVGEIADGLLTPNAADHIRNILGFSLRTAGPWADCVKSVSKDSDSAFHYRPDPMHPEWTAGCGDFETPSEQARMEDYVSRNWSNCNYQDFKKGCHETYHFADVAIEHDHYDEGFVGTNNHDIVHAINAALVVLKGGAAPSPFSIKDSKEAIFLLAHLLGDLHQPLHVGAVYLNSAGVVVDPDSGTLDLSTETVGGNSLLDRGHNLHAEWDAIPTYSSADLAAIKTEAASVPALSLPIDKWVAGWASDTIALSHDAFKDATFGAETHNKKWPITFGDETAHLTAEDAIKRAQLAKAGARLAQLLNAIWP